MRNDIWVIASHMVQEHGAEAPNAVHGKLMAMASDRVADQQFGLWFQVGLAVLEIIKERERHPVLGATT